MHMAAKSTTGQTPTVSAAKKLNTYDLAIGILALFSLILLVLIIFVPLQPSTEEVLNTLENLLCVVFLFDFFRRLFRVVRVMRTLKGNDFRRMLTQGIAQSTLLFTFVVALILIILDSGFALYVEKGAPHANI